jgi:hypothetical protein
MIESFGREANQDFERRFLGPRADLAEHLEIGDSPEESTAKWIENCKRMCEVPTLASNFDLAKAQAAEQETARSDALREWRARLDWQADKGHRPAKGEVDDPDPAPPESESWANQRVAAGYAVPRGGFVERSTKLLAGKLLAKMQSGASMETAIESLREEEYPAELIEAAAATVDA